MTVPMNLSLDQANAVLLALQLMQAAAQNARNVVQRAVDEAYLPPPAQAPQHGDVHLVPSPPA